MELEKLLERCRQGDELAWEALVRRYQGRVYGLAYHYLRGREEARDVAQEAFVRIYENLDGFEGSGAFVSWMTKITRNLCIDRLRKRKTRPSTEDTPIDHDTAGVHPGPGPEARTLAGDRRRLIRRALDRMTEINREMILLKDIQGLKQREIAELLSIPLGTVKTRSMRARLELAEKILEIDPSYGTGTESGA